MDRVRAAERFRHRCINANTLEQVQAIVQAAQAEYAPVIVQVSHNALLYIGSGNAALALDIWQQWDRLPRKV